VASKNAATAHRALVDMSRIVPEPGRRRAV
jgi:hypothetical protein